MTSDSEGVEGRPLTPYRIVSGWLIDANGSRIDPSGKMVYLAADVDKFIAEERYIEETAERLTQREVEKQLRAQLAAADAARAALRTCPHCGLVYSRGQDCPLCDAQAAALAVSELIQQRDALRQEVSDLKTGKVYTVMHEELVNTRAEVARLRAHLDRVETVAKQFETFNRDNLTPEEDALPTYAMGCIDSVREAGKHLRAVLSGEEPGR